MPVVANVNKQYGLKLPSADNVVVSAECRSMHSERRLEEEDAGGLLAFATNWRESVGTIGPNIYILCLIVIKRKLLNFPVSVGYW